MSRWTEREAVVAYIIDRAEQYNAGSGSRFALEVIAAKIAKGEHIESAKHGELDDLRARVRLKVRP